jgi:16S rRNA (guanine966-N2)-methyltransferase
VRIIAGSARGRPLRAATETRPTADLIKGAIFSMLEALAYKRGFEPDEDGNLAAGLAWPRVLDLFAGSGGRGIEALSRGAASAEFVDSDRDAVRTIQSNLRAADLGDRARVHQAPVEIAVRRASRPVDLGFLDPPYADADALQRAWATLGESDLLASTSVVVLEQPAEADPPTAVGPLVLVKTRRHGGTRISLYAAETT